MGFLSHELDATNGSGHGLAYRCQPDPSGMALEMFSAFNIMSLFIVRSEM